MSMARTFSPLLAHSPLPRLSPAAVELVGTMPLLGAMASFTAMTLFAIVATALAATFTSGLLPASTIHWEQSAPVRCVALQYPRTFQVTWPRVHAFSLFCPPRQKAGALHALLATSAG